MTSNFFSGPDIGIVSCQPRLGTNVKIWKVKMWGGKRCLGENVHIAVCSVDRRGGWNVNPAKLFTCDKDGFSLGRQIKTNWISRYGGNLSSRIARMWKMKLEGGRAGYEMSWLSDVKCDSSCLHVGSNNARACEIWIRKSLSPHFDEIGFL